MVTPENTLVLPANDDDGIPTRTKTTPVFTILPNVTTLVVVVLLPTTKAGSPLLSGLPVPGYAVAPSIHPFVAAEPDTRTYSLIDPVVCTPTNAALVPVNARLTLDAALTDPENVAHRTASPGNDAVVSAINPI
jgi:hypothetical protein